MMSYERYSERYTELFFNEHQDELERCSKFVKFVTLGLQYQNGKATGKTAVRLHVESFSDKVGLRQELALDRIPVFRKSQGALIDILVSNFVPAGPPFRDGDWIARDPNAVITGTLGTTVDGGFNLQWLTAAHVLSDVRDGGIPEKELKVFDLKKNQIGRVPPLGLYYVRDALADAALIFPSSQSSAEEPPADRTAGSRHLKKEDRVTMIGAQSGFQEGIVDSVSASNVTLKNGEQIRDHFYVGREDGTNFAQSGDSGAVVMSGKRILGVVRAAGERGPDNSVGITVVSRIEHVKRTLEFRPRL